MSIYGILLQDLLGEFGRRESYPSVLVFQMVSHPVVFLHGQDVFRRLNAVFAEPFRIHIEPARRLVHDFNVKLLSLF